MEVSVGRSLSEVKTQLVTLVTSSLASALTVGLGNIELSSGCMRTRSSLERCIAQGLGERIVG